AMRCWRRGSGTAHLPHSLAGLAKHLSRARDTSLVAGDLLDQPRSRRRDALLEVVGLAGGQLRARVELDPAAVDVRQRHEPDVLIVLLLVVRVDLDAGPDDQGPPAVVPV